MTPGTIGVLGGALGLVLAAGLGGAAVLAGCLLWLRFGTVSPPAARALDDLRRRQALEIHDNVVQGLARVTWALEASAYDHARVAADATLRDAQAMITGLLDEHPDGDEFGPGSLRRGDPPDTARRESAPA